RRLLRVYTDGRRTQLHRGRGRHRARNGGRPGCGHGQDGLDQWTATREWPSERQNACRGFESRVETLAFAAGDGDVLGRGDSGHFHTEDRSHLEWNAGALSLPSRESQFVAGRVTSPSAGISAAS